MVQWIVSSSEAGQRLVGFLKGKLGPHYSARQVKNGIENNLCRVNQRLEHFASAVLARGDKVSYEISALENKVKVSFAFSINDIIYEDQELLVFNKPACFASDGPEITQAIKNYHQKWELLHRLDRETTGLLMFTKGMDFRKQMISAFKSQKVKKVYLALVDGIPRQTSGIIDNYLGKLKSYEGQSLWGSVASSHEGHHAITAWEVQQKGTLATLICCYPKTGRTHQIRVHLSEMGHPILGDKQYGKFFICTYAANRCLLHAFELSFVHPTTMKKIVLQSPIPADFKQSMDSVL